MEHFYSPIHRPSTTCDVGYDRGGIAHCRTCDCRGLTAEDVMRGCPCNRTTAPTEDYPYGTWVAVLCILIPLAFAFGFFLGHDNGIEDYKERGDAAYWSKR